MVEVKITCGIDMTETIDIILTKEEYDTITEYHYLKDSDSNKRIIRMWVKDPDE